MHFLMTSVSQKAYTYTIQNLFSQLLPLRLLFHFVSFQSISFYILLHFDRYVHVEQLERDKPIHTKSRYTATRIGEPHFPCVCIHSQLSLPLSTVSHSLLSFFVCINLGGFCLTDFLLHYKINQSVIYIYISSSSSTSTWDVAVANMDSIMWMIRFTSCWSTTGKNKRQKEKCEDMFQEQTTLSWNRNPMLDR